MVTMHRNCAKHAYRKKKRQIQEICFRIKISNFKHINFKSIYIYLDMYEITDVRW